MSNEFKKRIGRRLYSVITLVLIFQLVLGMSSRESDTRFRETNLENVSKDAPLKLAVAAILAFPDGSMTASGLRREAAKGHLVIERIAGKDYTTLSAIAEMRNICRINLKVSGCGLGEVGAKSIQLGSSGTDQGKFALDAAMSKAMKLK